MNQSKNILWSVPKKTHDLSTLICILRCDYKEGLDWLDVKSYSSCLVHQLFQRAALERIRALGSSVGTPVHLLFSLFVCLFKPTACFKIWKFRMSWPWLEHSTQLEECGLIFPIRHEVHLATPCGWGLNLNCMLPMSSFKLKGFQFLDLNLFIFLRMDSTFNSLSLSNWLLPPWSLV